MKKLALALTLAVLAACESNSAQNQIVDPTAAFSKKPSKKCASCSYVLEGYGWNLMLVDTTAVPDSLIFSIDVGIVHSILRQGDLFYATNNYGELIAGDLSDPHAPYWGVNYSIGAELFLDRISGARLYGRYSMTEDRFGIGSIEWDIKDPLNPVLMRMIPDKDSPLRVYAVPIVDYHAFPLTIRLSRPERPPS